MKTDKRMFNEVETKDKNYTWDELEQENSKWNQYFKSEYIDNSNNHNLYYPILDELSNNMKNHLIALIENKESTEKKKTLVALKKRNLITEENKLTETGRYIAKASLNLKTQCKFLKIELSEEIIQKAGNVEESALKHYKKLGWDGFFSEGEVLFELLQACIFQIFESLGEKIFKNETKLQYELLQCSIFRCYSDKLIPILVKKICNIEQTELLQNLKKLRTIKNRINFDFGLFDLSFDSFSPHHSDFDIEKMNFLYSNLAIDLKFNLANTLLNRKIGGTGWPDLIIFKNGHVRNIEVKKKDKLILSQIFTIETLINNKIPVSVLKCN